MYIGQIVYVDGVKGIVTAMCSGYFYVQFSDGSGDWHSMEEIDYGKFSR